MHDVAGARDMHGARRQMGTVWHPHGAHVGTPRRPETILLPIGGKLSKGF